MLLSEGSAILQASWGREDLWYQILYLNVSWALGEQGLKLWALRWCAGPSLGPVDRRGQRDEGFSQEQRSHAFSPETLQRGERRHVRRVHMRHIVGDERRARVKLVGLRQSAPM